MKSRIPIFLEPNEVRKLSALARIEERELPSQAAYIVRQYLLDLPMPETQLEPAAAGAAPGAQGAQQP